MFLDIPECALLFLKKFDNTLARLTESSAVKCSHEGQDAQIWTSRTLQTHTHTHTDKDNSVLTVCKAYSFMKV